ncbi:hypothetical protein [Actinotalea sp. JY-7885]|uniref:hypothetical protein n=1 Tax=Actinotalea sp. JY-7885 TaxID=2758576 RepID=UPI00165DF391|nr:hypothetical protein [Actinotalea sp. JY-7885]
MRRRPRVRRAAPATAALVLVLVTACSPQGHPTFPTEEACRSAYPEPDVHCRYDESDDHWLATMWFPSEEICTAAKGRPCSPGRCETECEPLESGSGWA